MMRDWVSCRSFLKREQSGNGESGNRNVVGSELIMKLIVVV